jgi:ABC-2 type transport system ATP-binding protein
MDVSFALGAEVVGLVGRNGAGKSTLLKLACGLLRPSQGEVTVIGQSPAEPATRRQIGFSPDVERLYERVRGVDFVAWMVRLHGKSAKAARQTAQAMLDRLGLGAHMYRRIGEYSKGMRQRIRLAQVLAHEPRVVLLDEPMTGLDPVARHEMAVLVGEMAKGGTSVLVSSHVLHELEAMIDRVVLIHQGRLLAEGAVQELRGQLRGQPHRLRLTSDRPRVLAAALMTYEQVDAVKIAGDGVEVALSGQPGFYGALTRLGAEPDGLVREVAPLDDSLASVFGYLVG